MKITSVFSLIFVFFVTSSFGADIEEILKRANKEYDLDRYHNAIAIYEEALALDANNAEAHFKVGICYLETASLPKSLEHIEKAYELDAKVDKYYKYWHGKALHRNYRFEEAISEYEYYLDEFKNSKDTRDRKSVV